MVLAQIDSESHQAAALRQNGNEFVSMLTAAFRTHLSGSERLYGSLIHPHRGLADRQSL
jgi:hypothetical protein